MSRRPSDLPSSSRSKDSSSDHGNTGPGGAYAKHTSHSKAASTGAHEPESDPTSESQTAPDKSVNLSGSDRTHGADTWKSDEESSFRIVAQEFHLLYWLAAVPNSSSNGNSAVRGALALATDKSNTTTKDELAFDLDRQKLNRLIAQIQLLASQTLQGLRATQTKCTLSDIEAKLAKIVHSEPNCPEAEEKAEPRWYRKHPQRDSQGVRYDFLVESDGPEVRLLQPFNPEIHPLLTLRSSPTTQAAQGL